MSTRKEFRELIPPARARDIIASLPIDPATEQVPITVARGRVTAERIDATTDVPGFDRATMDGYAVQAADTVGADEQDPVELRVVGTVHAGDAPSVTVGSGEAAEISTGAVIPPGADAVVMVERTGDPGPERVSVRTAVAPGDQIMAAGADIGAGTRAIGPGRRLAARDLALLAALGRDTVSVRSRPRVGVISTGDELVAPGERLNHDAGEIYDVNGHALAAGIEEAGGTPTRYDPIPDEVETMRAVLERAATECDLVLTSGSTSASAVDVIYDVIAERGELLAHGVAVKPGKPMIIGRLGSGTAYVGLPGYPVSAQMVFRRFVAPAVRDAAGLPEASAPELRARMATEARFDEGRMRLLPVGLRAVEDQQVQAYPVDKGSGATTSLADADGVVEVPADTAFVGTEEQVVVHLFDAGVQLPEVLAVGEPDLALYELLDAITTPRFLPVGTAEGTRRFDRGIPDVLIRRRGADPPVADTHCLARWEREWGLVVPAGNPLALTGIGALLDADVLFANAAENALRAAIDAKTMALADQQATDVDALRGRIAGYGIGRPGLESPARRVHEGEADAAVGLVATADRLDLDCIPVGTQELVAVAQADSTSAPGVESFTDAAEALTTFTDRLPGYQLIQG